MPRDTDHAEVVDDQRRKRLPCEDDPDQRHGAEPGANVMLPTTENAPSPTPTYTHHGAAPTRSALGTPRTKFATTGTSTRSQTANDTSVARGGFRYSAS